MIEIVSSPELHMDIARWVDARIPGEYYRSFPDDTKSIGLTENGQLVAGVVYYGYTLYDMMMAVAIVKGVEFPRRALRAVFAYPFDQCNCLRVTANIASRNKPSIKTVERLGFIYEGTIRCATPSDDYLQFGLLRKDCQWLKPHSGK